MGFAVLFAGLLLVLGIADLRTYIKRKQWPVVKGTVDSVDVKVDATAYSKGVGFSIRPRFIYKVSYSFRGNPYEVVFSENKPAEEMPELRVNPEKPNEAFLDNKTLTFPILAIGIGTFLLLLLLKPDLIVPIKLSLL